MVRVNVAEAKARLSELIDSALEGEEVVIARRGKPLVRLAVLREGRVKPEAGRFKGRIRLAPDFDAPLEDFGEYTG
jgi:antitoxin (DNA-binding transcriptional repressor) of toxin-antitoxin stability system